ncbi:hypothetical protein BH18THE2_BH18THE2_23390 [soil metagenome]
MIYTFWLQTESSPHANNKLCREHLDSKERLSITLNLIFIDYSAILMKYKHSLVTNISKNLLKDQDLSIGENKRQKNLKPYFR